MKLPLKGIIPPMVTPLLKNMELDLNGLNKLIEHLIQGGVHGIFLLGTNGEGPSLSYPIRKQLIEEACKIVNKRVTVLVNITDSSIDSALEIAEYAKLSGADALVVAPPYYFPISQEEMIDYLEVLAPKLPLPFLIYDIPSCTKLHLSIKTIKRAKELGAIGVKDSSGDMGTFYQIIEEFKEFADFSVIAGAEIFLSDTILNGGHGAVAGGANLFPRLFVELYEASCAKDLEKIKLLRESVIKMHSTLYNLGSTSTKSIRAIKCALSILGICSDHMAQPLSRFGEKNREKIREYLGEFEYDGHYKVV
ncbi:dihydrodipicolinate synthase family protein [uncultured Maribacter sp.]|uniref:dihydrodipicolinate synthase family protein n=1 Tax=uncultured Maribacter sp. TaxID=431308 RepID=UPI0030EDC845|tara:strand:+ start:65458 stop:66378 length:921 start_codon:yes stop_codon:yes gene_type:complete